MPNSLLEHNALWETVCKTGTSPKDLDDMVHETMACRASNINNQGLHAQIAFLEEEFCTSDLIDILLDMQHQREHQDEDSNA